jgi:hypothetical protein
MAKLRIELTLEELQELVELVDNQLFRMKFIDTKLPGHKLNPEKVRTATSAVNVLREVFKTAKGFKTNVA